MKITFFAGLRHRLFNMLPYLAAFYALALNLGYGFFCGSLLFLINLSGSRVLGFAVLSAQHIISYLIRFKYLPFFISVFSNHGFSEDAALPSVGFVKDALESILEDIPA